MCGSHAAVRLVDEAHYNHKLMSDITVGISNTRNCVVSRIECLLCKWWSHTRVIWRKIIPKNIPDQCQAFTEFTK